MDDAFGDARADFIYYGKFVGFGVHDGIDGAEAFGQDAAGFGADEADAQSEEDAGEAYAFAGFDGFEEVVG